MGKFTQQFFRPSAVLAFRMLVFAVLVVVASSITFVPTGFAQPTDCLWTRSVADRNGTPGPRTICPSQFSARGIRCSGQDCRAISLYCCRQPASLGVTTQSSSGWISEEQGSAPDANGLIWSARCSGDWCDGIDAILRTPTAASVVSVLQDDCQRTAFVSSASPVPATCRPGYWATNILCRGTYCSQVALRCCRVDWGNSQQSASSCFSTRYFSSAGASARPPGNRAECPSGFVMRGASCIGNYCGIMSIYCCPYMVGADTAASPSQWVGSVSSQMSGVFPAHPTGFVNGLQCDGSNCASLSLRFVQSPNLPTAGACTQGTRFSEEQGHYMCPAGTAVRGLSCDGTDCDNISLNCCALGCNDPATCGANQPRPFDLVSTSTDWNGFPLNPRWQAQVTNPGTRPDPTSCEESDFRPPCTNNLVTWDGWGSGPAFSNCRHANWQAATHVGSIRWVGYSHQYVWDDNDLNFDMQLAENAGLTGSQERLHLEFDRGETTSRFGSPFWRTFDQGVSTNLPSTLFDSSDAVITGLFGLDCMHGCTAESHPVYAFAARVWGSELVHDDQWAYFARRTGNEGWCSSQNHPISWQRAFIRLPAPSSSVTNARLTSRSDLYGANGAAWVGASFDATTTPPSLLVEFSLPSDNSIADGVLHIEWQSTVPISPRTRPTTAPQSQRGGDEREIEALEHRLSPQQRAAFETRLRQIEPQRTSTPRNASVPIPPAAFDWLRGRTPPPRVTIPPTAQGVPDADRVSLQRAQAEAFCNISGTCRSGPVR